MNKLKIMCAYIRRFLRLELPEFIAKHCPVHIPTRKPECPNHVCPNCGKTQDQLKAFFAGDGYVFFWECENGCGDCEDISHWWPFWFGAWANEKRLRRIGIESV